MKKLRLFDIDLLDKDYNLVTTIQVYAYNLQDANDKGIELVNNCRDKKVVFSQASIH